tara:strand:- start:109 stop:246 length:138 start_codon:yes stop_codon:yes gene_type:complete
MKIIKKIILTLIISCLAVSCGKKGDPKYKDTNKEINKTRIEINYT